MAHPQRGDAVPAYTPPQPAPGGYRPGGQVGRMQAELADRLAPSGLAWEPAGASESEAPGERMVRFLSVAGGYLALLLAYAGVALPFLR